MPNPKCPLTSYDLHMTPATLSTILTLATPMGADSAEAIFRSLRTVLVDVINDTSILAAPLILQHKLISIDVLFCKRDISSQAITDFLRLVPERCPDLRWFRFRLYATPEGALVISQVMETSVNKLKALRTFLGSRDFVMTPKTMESLSTLPDLRSLQFGQYSDDEPPERLNLDDKSFPMLYSLHLKTPNDHVVAALRSPYFPPSSLNEFTASSISSTTSLTGTLSHLISKSHKLRSIDLSLLYGSRFDSTHLELISKLKHLRTLCISSSQDLGLTDADMQACIPQLPLLRKVTITSKSTSSPDKITLQTLQTLVYQCLCIGTIHLTFDASAIPSSDRSDWMVKNSRLSTSGSRRDVMVLLTNCMITDAEGVIMWFKSYLAPYVEIDLMGESDCQDTEAWKTVRKAI